MKYGKRRLKYYVFTEDCVRLCFTKKKVMQHVRREGGGTVVKFGKTKRGANVKVTTTKYVVRGRK